MHVGSRAPHSGIFVFFAIDNVLWFVLSVLYGTLITCAGVVLLKQMAARKRSEEAREEAVAAA